MKFPKIHPILAGFLLFPAMLSAQTFLSVDMNAGAGSPSPTQTGFTAFNTGTSATAGPRTATFTGLGTEFTSIGSVTVTIAWGGSTATDLTGTGTFLARDRAAPANTGSFTTADLYRDMLQSTGTGVNGQPVAIGFSGLLANTAYDLRFFAYDHSASGSRTMTFTDFSSGSAGGTGSITYTGASVFDSSTSNNVFSTLISVTSDSNGKILLTETPGGSYGVALNGFVLSASSVPEPSTYAMISGALVLTGSVLSRRRRQQ
jgi:hypothetical protein